jgi:uncharacterized cupredoxin-like copper-binding protein
MKKHLLASALTLSLVCTGTLADETSGSAGKPGDLGKVSRTVEITAVDNRFKPDEIKVKQGETIKFLVKNKGEKKHEFMLGTAEEVDDHGKMMKKNPDMEHPEEPNMIKINPGESRELVWYFPEAGTVSFACPLPGHFKGMNFPGMKGLITVEAK